jgi:pyrroline-5-carboxylate reductase
VAARGKIGIIGVGNMGSAIVQGVLRAALFAPDEIVVCDVVREKAEDLSKALKIHTEQSAAEVARAASTIIIAVKPQTMEQCLTEIKGTVTASHIIISIAAGISTGFLEKRLPAATHVVRAMPNTPALVGAGATVLCAGSHASDKDMSAAEDIFTAVGKVFRAPESLMDAVTAVSGSGPAYLFYFAECLSDAAVQNGLPRQQAVALVTQTVFGSAKLLSESGEEASVLRAKVTSPGGTTEAALKIFKQHGFDGILAAAVRAAVERGRELGGAKKN